MDGLKENCNEETKSKNTTTNVFDIRMTLDESAIFFLSPFYSSFILPVSIQPIKGLLCFGILGGKKSDARCFAASEILNFVKKWSCPVFFNGFPGSESVAEPEVGTPLFIGLLFRLFFLGMMGVAHFSSALRICMTRNFLNSVRKLLTE